MIAEDQAKKIELLENIGLDDGCQTSVFLQLFSDLLSESKENLIARSADVYHTDSSTAASIVRILQPIYEATAPISDVLDDILKTSTQHAFKQRIDRKVEPDLRTQNVISLSNSSRFQYTEASPSYAVLCEELSLPSRRVCENGKLPAGLLSR